jgi:hypothetical protein
MIPDNFEHLPINEKISLFIQDIVINRKGETKTVMKETIKIERWFLKGNQWIGPKGIVIEIIGATNGHQENLQRYVGTPISSVERRPYEKRTKNI